MYSVEDELFALLNEMLKAYILYKVLKNLVLKESLSRLHCVG